LGIFHLVEVSDLRAVDTVITLTCYHKSL